MRVTVRILDASARWGCSSAGRALRSQCRGQGFESPHLHSVKNTDIYSLEEINQFLDVTYKKSIKLHDYFNDGEKFIRSVGVLKRMVGFDLLDEKKRFRLKKHITTLRKAKKGKTAKKIKK